MFQQIKLLLYPEGIDGSGSGGGLTKEQFATTECENGPRHVVGNSGIGVRLKGTGAAQKYRNRLLWKNYHATLFWSCWDVFLGFGGYAPRVAMAVRMDIKPRLTIEKRREGRGTKLEKVNKNKGE